VAPPWGPPPGGGGGGAGPPPTPEGGNAATTWERRGTTLGRIGEDERRGTTLGRVGEDEQGIRDHSSTQIDRREPPPTCMVEDQVEGKREEPERSIREIITATPYESGAAYVRSQRRTPPKEGPTAS